MGTESTNMLKKIILASFIIWIVYALGTLLITYNRIYLQRTEAQLQLNKQLAEQERINKMTVEEILKEIPPKYGVKPETVKKIAFCESSYRYNAVGDGGHAYGVMQFHKPTFDGFSKKYGKEYDYKSTLDQVELASEMISKGNARHWTCAKKTGVI